MFTKDLLLIDEEMTGVDPTRHEIIQLAGILLDKKTLKEKKHFTSFVKPKHWSRRDPEAMAVSRITWEQVKNAPPLETALQKFSKTFGHQVLLANYGGNIDYEFLKTGFRQANLRYPYNYHTFNIWGVILVYCAKKKLLKPSFTAKEFGGFNLERVLAHFSIPTPPLHDALVDCRAEAEVLRRVLKALKV
jgi:DNA polymerase III epsilon subunit-like protein